MHTGLAKRVMIFIDETDRWHLGNLGAAIVDRLRKEGCSGATVLRGSVGFGVHGQVHTTAIVDLSVNLPVVIIVIDEADKIDRVLPMLQEMVTEGLIVVDEVQAFRQNNKGEPRRKPDVHSTTVEHLVSEYMDVEPITIPAEMQVVDIIGVLLKNHRAYLPVVNDERILLGVVGSQDLLNRIVHVPQGAFRFFSLHGIDKQEAGQDIKTLTASQVMRTQVAAVGPQTSMVKAVQIMLHDHVSALPVVDNQKLVGILRLPDLLRKALDVEYPTAQDKNE